MSICEIASRSETRSNLIKLSESLGVNTKPAAGQVVFHTHLHIIPRFTDDGLKHWPHKKLEKEEMVKVQEAVRKILAQAQQGL